MTEALIVVDMQNDFITGSLAVKGGAEIVPAVNKLIADFARKKAPIFFTRDLHPSNHVSFQRFGGQWPEHCVRDTWGAEIHPDILMPPGSTLIAKGTQPDIEAYSGFDHTPLDWRLHSDRIDTLVVCGIATDYCVKATVLDALKLGYNVRVVLPAIAAVDTTTGYAAIMDMWARGAWFEAMLGSPVAPSPPQPRVEA